MYTKKMYTIKEIAEIAGVTLKTLRHYDKIGLLSPSRRKPNNYRFYDDNDLNKLQQIMLYKELDLSLQEINLIINKPDFDITQSLENQIKSLKSKVKHLNEIIELAQKTIKNIQGELKMSSQEKFEAFKTKMIEDNDRLYKEEVIEKYGEDAYQSSNQKFLNLSQEQYLQLEKLSTMVDEAFIIALKTNNPQSQEAVDAVKLHLKWLMHFWTEFSKEAYLGLANLYVDDHRFAKYYNRLDPQMAVFVRDSIINYCHHYLT